MIEQLVRKESDMSPPPPSLPLSPLQLRAATATIRPHFVTSLKSLDVLHRLLTEHTSGASSWVRAHTHTRAQLGCVIFEFWSEESVLP